MLQQAGAEFFAITLRLLEFLLRCCSGSCGGSAITLRFGLGGLLLLQSRCLGLPFLALSLVTCAKCFGGVSLGADCLSLGGGLTIRRCSVCGVYALLLLSL